MCSHRFDDRPVVFAGARITRPTFADVAAAVHAARATFGHLHGAVNNAGGVVAPEPLDQVSGRAWHEELVSSIQFPPAVHLRCRIVKEA